MLCLRCKSETFYRTVEKITQIYKGKTFKVKTPIVKCVECGWVTVANDQIDELVKNTKEVYKTLDISQNSSIVIVESKP